MSQRITNCHKETVQAHQGSDPTCAPCQLSDLRQAWSPLTKQRLYFWGFGGAQQQASGGLGWAASSVTSMPGTGGAGGCEHNHPRIFCFFRGNIFTEM